MKVICENLPASRKRCIAAIGVFDGIHLGHRCILTRLIEEADKKDCAAVLITFDIPPKMLLNKKFEGCITSSDDKKNIVRSLGIDYLWFLRTHASFLELSGREFIEYIIKYFDVEGFIVGEDFRFGYKGETDVLHFKKYGGEYGFSVEAVKKISKHNQIISSSLIRKFIKEADFQEAEKFLGRKYILRGSVHRGMRYGGRIGFPTANIDTFDYVVPSNGVYAAMAEVDKKSYLSAVNIGFRPTVCDLQKKVMEAHIFDFNQDIIGRTIAVTFLQKIREEKKFTSINKLKEAINQDARYIKKKFVAKSFPRGISQM